MSYASSTCLGALFRQACSRRRRTGDGSIPPGRYPHASELPAALRVFAPGVRAQAFVALLPRGRVHYPPRPTGALPRPPRRPYGVALYAEWTTDHHDWVTYREEWLSVVP